MTNNDETICGYKLHRFIKLFPSMNDEEYQSLKEDIKLNGQLEPVIINSNKQIIDGYHRSKCVSELGLKLKTKTFSGNDAEILELCLSLNLKRRMLSHNQKSLLGRGRRA